MSDKNRVPKNFKAADTYQAVDLLFPRVPYTVKTFNNGQNLPKHAWIFEIKGFGG